MRDEQVREEVDTPEGDTSGAEYLAEDDRTKTTGYNGVPHHRRPPPPSAHIPRVRREAGQRPPQDDRYGRRGLTALPPAPGCDAVARVRQRRSALATALASTGRVG